MDETASDHSTVVTTVQGDYRGSRAGGVLCFKGIPYAAAPAGVDRFTAPRLPEPHNGIVDAVEYGATVSAPPQRSAVIDRLLPDPVRPGSNGLNLNIWTPDAGGSAPVFVFIHGGGFVTGAGSTSAFDGTAFARDGVVAVTINYRLAADGFLAIPGAPANRGLLDQIAALEWLQQNITAFGGDPGRVTIAGESAGAMSVLTLLAMPAARGLFRRAISQSGDGHHVHTPEQAALIAAEVAAELDVPLTVDALLAVPIDALHAATNATISRVGAGGDPRFASFTRLVVQPVVDGETLPEHPLAAAAAGAGSEIDVVIGMNGDEYGLFVAPFGLSGMGDDVLTRSVERLIGDSAFDVLNSYREQRPGATPAELFIAIQSDWFCRVPATRYADARRAAGAESYLYDFTWRPSTYDGELGAFHTLEIPFVFDTLDDPWGLELRGADAPQNLADVVHRAWVQFVSTGDPGWPVYGDERRVQRLDLNSHVEIDPESYRRTVWGSSI
ncbi:MAG: Carboxylesterase [Subtercola sp.]|nr:Carboxylesterase [Subtercola sp.]